MKHVIFALLLAVAGHLFGSLSVTAQHTDPCYVCRRSDRFIVNRDHSFELTDIYGDTFTWTCGQLEDNGLTIRVSNSVCGIFVAHAESSCECGGPPINPGFVKNENPLCDICIDGRAVPEIKVDELVDTGVAGEMPCGFLYDAAATGFMPPHLCPIIQQNVAEFCCTIPAVDPGNPGGDGNGGDSNGGDSNGTANGDGDGGDSNGTANGDGNDAEPTCGDLHDDCSPGSLPCCSNLDCKARTIGASPTCSARRRPGRTSLANGRGGAAGAAKLAN